MIRNLKALGLALVAVFAMSAVAASAASADHFTSTAETTVLTGTNTDLNIFEIESPSVKVECHTAKFAGTQIGKATETVTVFPTYFGTAANANAEKCNSTLGEAKVDMNKCAYILTGNTTGVDNGTDAIVSVECPTGVEIEITGPGCTIQIPSQTPTSGGVTYTNGTENAKGDVTVKATSTGITYTTTGSFCGLVGLKAEGNNSKYTGSVTVTGWEDKGQGATYDEFLEGSQVGIEVSA